MLFVFVATLFFLILVVGCMPGTAGPTSLPSGAPTKDEKKSEEKAPSFISAEDDEELAANQIRFNKQCWLIDSFEDLVREVFETAPKKSFNSFSTITDDPALVTTELVSNKRVNPLFQIKPHQLALLQPRIKLFIVKRGGDNKPEEIPLKFASGFNQGSIGPGQNYEDLFKSSNLLGAGAGIKSFSYELAGVNPAEADKLIEASLTLYFQSIGDLFAVRGKSSSGEDVRFADLINYGPSKGKESAVNQRKIRPEDFRIKAVVGWSEPEVAQSQQAGILSEEMAEALVQSKTTLFLQLVDHTLSFRQEGNVELEIKYMAALQQTIESSKMDLFWSPIDLIVTSLEQAASSTGLKYATARKQRIEKAIDDLNKFIKTNNALERKLKPDELQKIEQLLQESLSAGGTGHYTDEYETKSFTKLYKGGYELGDLVKAGAAGSLLGPAGTAIALGTAASRADLRPPILQRADKDIEDAQGRAKTAKENLDKIKAQRRDFIYRRIVDSLVADKLIYIVDVSKEDLGIFQNKQIANTQVTIEARGASPSRAAKGQSVKKASNKQADLAQIVKTDDGRKTSELLQATKTRTIEQATGNQKESTAPVFFFFFGDLVDTAIKTLVQPQTAQGIKEPFKNTAAVEALKEFTILMGPVSFYDEKTGQIRIINVSQIPISFDLFQQWWLEKVVKPQRVSYELRDFLKDAMRELIAPGLGQGCYNGYRQSGKMSMIPLTIPKKARGQSRIPKWGARCRLADIRNARAAPVSPERKSTQIRKLDNYLYFFIADEYTKTRKVNVEKDNRDGIYHLRIGEDRGIVKSIDFHQTDIQFLKEARITNDADVKDGFLRKKYDAKIKTIGNTLFAPGQYLYIHPTVPGASSDAMIRQQLQKIGLGGYYLVTKVFHIISQDYYQAEIEAKWEAFGVAENDKITKITNYQVLGDQSPCQGAATDPSSALMAIDITEGSETLAAAKKFERDKDLAGDIAQAASAGSLLGPIGAALAAGAVLASSDNDGGDD